MVLVELRMDGIRATLGRRIRIVSLCTGFACYLRMAKMSTGDIEVMQETCWQGNNLTKHWAFHEKTYQILFRPYHIGESVRPSEHCFVGHTVSKILKVSSDDAHVCLPDRSRSACAKMKSLIADQWLHSSLSGCVSPDRLFKPFEAVTENKDRNNTGYVICHHSIITVV